MVVPHFYQSSERACGAACLRMLFAAFGVAHDEATVAQCCSLTPLGNTVQDLIAGAQALNFNAALLATLDEPSARAALSRDTPFVAMIDLASLHNQGAVFQWHFVVPVALAGDELIYHDPADGPDRRVKVDDFLVAWATAGYRGVRVWTP